MTATLAEVELEVGNMNIAEDSADNNSIQNDLIVVIENDENATSNSEPKNNSGLQTKQADTQKLSKKRYFYVFYVAVISQLYYKFPLIM